MDYGETIRRLGGNHAENLRRMLDNDRPEDEDEYLTILYRLLDDSGLPELQRTESFRLTFAELIESSGEEDPLRCFAVSFVAVMIEGRLKPEATVPQVGELSRHYQRLVDTSRELKLPAHAIVLAQLVSRLELDLGDVAAADKYLYLSCVMADARTSKRVSTRMFPRVLVGYGYRPYRLVLAWLVCATLFTGIYIFLGEAPLRAGVLSMGAQLGAVGVSDVEPGGLVIELLVLLQTALGILGVAVFFALSVRRWFRI